MVEIMDMIETRATCPACGKSLVVNVTAWKGHGTGTRGEVTFSPMTYETVSAGTHCTCPEGPCETLGLLGR